MPLLRKPVFRQGVQKGLFSFSLGFSFSTSYGFLKATCFACYRHLCWMLGFNRRFSLVFVFKLSSFLVLGAFSLV